MRILFYIILSSLIFAGCGKKKEEAKQETKQAAPAQQSSEPRTSIPTIPTTINSLSPREYYSYFTYDVNNIFNNHPGVQSFQGIISEYNYLYLEFIYQYKPAWLKVYLYESGFCKIIYSLDASQSDQVTIRDKWSIQARDLNIANMFKTTIVDEKNYKLAIQDISNQTSFASFAERAFTVQIKRDPNAPTPFAKD